MSGSHQDPWGSIKINLDLPCFWNKFSYFFHLIGFPEPNHSSTKHIGKKKKVNTFPQIPKWCIVVLMYYFFKQPFYYMESGSYSNSSERRHRTFFQTWSVVTRVLHGFSFGFWHDSHWKTKYKPVLLKDRSSHGSFCLKITNSKEINSIREKYSWLVVALFGLCLTKI